MRVSYVELHAHSAYSFLDGASQPEELAARAAELGYPAGQELGDTERHRRLSRARAVLGDVDRHVADQPHAAIKGVPPQRRPLAVEPHLVGDRAAT